ncbi:hypothetical protein HU200_030317 [Digitaria exilis]|uniref:non-specific serine/threonine protein kinase n=1 Tax=Digitaria exilis TaxID=1010633 RepID=A0A835C320_9POAL|nr:hypothetical protein HU200_030317 [Digitaria exilis]
MRGIDPPLYHLSYIPGSARLSTYMFPRHRPNTCIPCEGGRDPSFRIQRTTPSVVFVEAKNAGSLIVLIAREGAESAAQLSYERESRQAGGHGPPTTPPPPPPSCPLQIKITSPPPLSPALFFFSILSSPPLPRRRGCRISPFPDTNTIPHPVAMPPDGEAAAADLAADELQSLSFGSSSDRSRSRSASTVSTATASCSTSSSGPLHLPLPPRSTGNPSAAASAQAAVVPRLGSVSLSDIRFLRRLGAGDIGSVYLAEVRPKDRHHPSGGGAAVLVAAKVMDRKELEGRNKEGRARTEREILEAVDHPFLPRLYGVAEGDRWSCLLTEFCPGGDLHVLRQRQPHRRFSEAAVSDTWLAVTARCESLTVHHLPATNNLTTWGDDGRHHHHRRIMITWYGGGADGDEHERRPCATAPEPLQQHQNTVASNMPALDSDTQVPGLVVNRRTEAQLALPVCVLWIGLFWLQTRVKFYAAEVVAALEYVHMVDIVYRDLKPENVLVRADGHIMLTDFDLSLKCDPTAPTPAHVISDPLSLAGRSATSTSCTISSCIVPTVSCFQLFPGRGRSRRRRRWRIKKPSSSGGGSNSFPSSNSSSSGLDLEFVAEPVELRSMSFVGTHEYLAPEIVSGEGHGSSVDWWTLGVFIFELLYGVTPFKGYDNEMTLANIVARALEFPKEPSVSSAAKDLVTALLAKDPARRLGATVGAAAIKRHPFFNGVNWALLRCAAPPYVPPPFTVANANKAGNGGGNNGNDEDVSDDDSCPGTPVEYY